MHPRNLPQEDRLVYLAEYSVREGIPLLASQPSRVAPLELIDEVDGPLPTAPVADPAPLAEPALAADPVGAVPGDLSLDTPADALAAPAPEAAVDPAAPSPAADKMEVLTQLAHAENDRIGELLARFDEMSKQIEQVNLTGESRVRAVDQRLDGITNQVKRLTPPSPLEQLKSMAAISGGVSMEDYFNEWAEKNGDPTRVGPNGMYQAAEDANAEGQTYYVDTAKVPDLSVDAAKRSLGVSSSGGGVY